MIKHAFILWRKKSLTKSLLERNQSFDSMCIISCTQHAVNFHWEMLCVGQDNATPHRSHGHGFWSYQTLWCWHTHGPYFTQVGSVPDLPLSLSSRWPWNGHHTCATWGGSYLSILSLRHLFLHSIYTVGMASVPPSPPGFIYMPFHPTTTIRSHAYLTQPCWHENVKTEGWLPSAWLYSPFSLPPSEVLAIDNVNDLLPEPRMGACSTLELACTHGME